MTHSHAHTDDHSHNHNIILTNVNTAFIIGIVLNFLFVLIEVIVGLSIHSLSLLSDAGHNLADVGSLALSLLAFRLLKVKSNERFTYGFRKTTILTALFNAVVLLVLIGALAYEAVHRLFHPAPLPGNMIAIVAAIGIVINASTALLFMKDKDKDINVKSAYLHLMADALVSVGLVAGGIIISFTKWYWVDPLLSLIVAFVIVAGTWNLLKESLRLSLDAVPKGIDLITIKDSALHIPGVQEIHHIHVWAMSTTENAMTAHIILASGLPKEQESTIKNTFRHAMQHLNIQHVTIETEREIDDCGEVPC